MRGRPGAHAVSLYLGRHHLFVIRSRSSRPRDLFVRRCRAPTCMCWRCDRGQLSLSASSLCTRHGRGAPHGDRGMRRTFDHGLPMIIVVPLVLQRSPHRGRPEGFRRISLLRGPALCDFTHHGDGVFLLSRARATPSWRRSACCPLPPSRSWRRRSSRLFWRRAHRAGAPCGHGGGGGRGVDLHAIFADFSSMATPPAMQLLRHGPFARGAAAASPFGGRPAAAAAWASVGRSRSPHDLHRAVRSRARSSSSSGCRPTCSWPHALAR